MNVSTCEAIWSILRTTFDSLSRVVQAKLPEVKTSSRRNRNNYFPLRAYLEFALPEKQVVISFDVHNEKCGVSVRGDIYVQHDSGDGSSIEDIVDFELGSSEATDERLIRIATDFSVRLQTIDAISAVLTELSR